MSRLPGLVKQPSTNVRSVACYTNIAVAEATQRALTCLYSRNFLPANPFPLFAEIFSGSLDQSGVWRLTNQQVVGKLQEGGPAVLTKSAADLAHLSQCNNAWGLPHVLACVCRKGVDIICSVIADHLPRTFYPTFRPSDPDTDGYLVQVLPSLQGRCISYQPDWQAFPLLEVRADVVVVGPSPTMAVVKLARLVVRDATDLSAQGHYIQALVLQAPPKADGSVPFYVPLSLDMLSESDEVIVQLLQPGIQGGSCIVCSMVVALKVPQQGSGSKGQKEWRHMPASKSYHLHVGTQTDSSLSFNVLPPIDSFTVAVHDALFTGVFLQEAAAKRYISLNKAATPYSQVLPNMTAMLQQLTLNYAAGQVLWAYHALMLLTFLLDPQLSGAAPQPDPALDPNASAKAALGLDGLTQLLDLVTNAEEEESSRQAKLLGSDSDSRSSSDSESESGNIPVTAEVEASGQDESTPAKASNQTPATSSAASLGPLLIRMLNGFAAVLTGIAEELQALQWLLGQLQKQPALPSAVEEKLLLHMHSLLTRILHVTPEAVPEGGRAVVQGLLAEALQPLTAAAESAASLGKPESSPDTMLASLATPVAKLQSLLTGVSMTHAQALLNRAPEVAAFASQLKVDLHLLDIKTGGEASPWIAPDWVLDVTKEAHEQQQCRDFPDIMTVEGVLLQYAVDTRLYEALQHLHQMLTCPPIPVNPFPRLTRLFLEYGCRLDHSHPGDASQLWNEMTRLPDTDFMYKALPAGPHKQASKLPANPMNAQRQTIASEDKIAAVFGCYSAVAAADAEAVHGLAEKLPYFFKRRSWQSGAYQIDVIQTVTEDASFSNAFALHSSRADLAAANGGASSSSMGGAHKHSRTVPAYLHERGFDTVTEEHYLVSGPYHAEAVQLFIKAFQKWLEDTHLHTEHDINRLRVGDDREFSLDELRERPHAVANALSHQLQQQTDGCMVAEVHVAAAPLQESHRHPEGLRHPIYITLTRQVVFQYQGVKKVKLGQHHRILDDKDGWNDNHSEAEDAAHWDSSVYNRVFLEADSAQLWESWNRDRGDPALPFHHLPMLAALAKAAAAAADEQDCTTAIKLRIRSAVIAHHQAEAEQAAKALRGLSQELTSLHGHMQGIIHTGTAQANAVASVLDWDRLQGALATVLDKAMYLMVIARLPLCNKGVSQEVESLLNQQRAMALRADSWDSACMLLSQLKACTLYCAAVHASISLGCLEKQCVLVQAKSKTDAGS